MQIAGYLKTSLIEWPGKICSVIFTPGCNFRCPFCHNADLVRNRGLSLADEEQIFADLASRKKWVDAVVITGGEPTLQKDLPEFLRKVKKMGFLTMIQTNGTRPQIIASLLHCSIVDYVCLDLKGDFKNYSNYTNYFNDQIISKVKESTKLIIESGIEYEFRTTVVPGLHDIKNLISLAEQIKFLVQSSILRQSSRQEYKVQNCRWYLQQFRPKNCLEKKYLKVEPFSKEQMEGFQNSLKKIIPQVFLRGI